MQTHPLWLATRLLLAILVGAYQLAPSPTLAGTPH